MGTWGPGNLECDAARDLLGDRSAELTKAVWDGLRDPLSAEADEIEHDALFVSLEWLLAVDAAGCFDGWKLPTVAALDPVLEAWLARWATAIEELAGADFQARRREVIEHTFARLRAVCARVEAERA
ncbi:MAG: hypothetical protein H6738_04330 [Alphaproteobacteria bacterium]|nr:hypothetical protein [Alphaproteobacteria bacterium]MCB9695999.1 hypothetical protein [Alphaproteobacteria bacterium]